MVFIRCSTFIQCLPLASGVWLLSVVGMMLGVSAAIGSWMEVNLLESHPNPTQDIVAVFAQAIVFSLLAFFSLMGFVNGIIKNRHLAFVYPKILATHYILMLAVFGYSMYYSFRSVDQLTVSKCLAGSIDEMVNQFCRKGLNLIKLLPLIWYIAAAVIQPYAFILADNFAEKLEIDDIARVPKSFLLNSDAISFRSKDVEDGLGPPMTQSQPFRVR